MPATTVYCYHCCAQHPQEQMRLVATKTGNRWRCKKSIDAAAKADKDMALRQAFGQQAAEKNKFSAQLARQARERKFNNRFNELYK